MTTKPFTIAGVQVHVRMDHFHLGISNSVPIDFIIAHECIAQDAYGLRRMKEEGFHPKRFLDLGANIGSVSVYVKHLWPDCRTILIEPGKDHLDVARISLSTHNDVEFFCAWAGSKNVTEGGWRPDPNDALPIMTGSALLEFAPFDLVKIDIEGCERDVLSQVTMSQLGYRIVGEWHGLDTPDILKAAAGNTHLLISYPVILDNTRGMFYAIRI